METLLDSTDENPLKILTVIGAVVSVGLAYFLVGRPIYRLTLHPLSRYPGPKLWAITRLPLSYHQYQGHYHVKLLELHKKYGEVVRTAPNQISFVKPEAWKEVMGHRKKGEKENSKDPVSTARNPDSIVSVYSREGHSMLRRNLSHGFSAKRMLEQQPLIRQYIDLFFERLREHARGDPTKPLNIVAWYNYTTFDIIGDLAFGESFQSLENSALHPWIALIFDSLRQSTMLNITRKYIRNIDQLIAMVSPSSIAALRGREEYTREKLSKRLANKEPRPDFVDSMLRAHEGAPAQTLRQLEQNSNILILAGSETTATALSFATYLLCTHPEVMQKLTSEVDESFSDESEIEIASVQNLKYMLAVLDESMRLFPPAAIIEPRVAPPGGAQIFGEYVPAWVCGPFSCYNDYGMIATLLTNLPGDGTQTELGLEQAVINRYPGNFAMADEFIPERWLGDPRFVSDRKDAFHPFSHGPRDCIGKKYVMYPRHSRDITINCSSTNKIRPVTSLAYAEMRIILARMLFNFDITLAEDSKSWTKDMRVWTLWDKPGMNVYLKLRR